MPKPLIAVVSPFIDKRHGTERSIAECLERLSGEYEIHVYSNRVEDLDLDRIVWHHVPALPGPHLLSYVWWFVANHLWRRWDREVRDLHPAIVFSPGINCLDADVIYVHVVFARLREHMREQLFFASNPWNTWHRVAHRRIYYSLIAFLERQIYPNPETPLIAVSNKTAADLSRFYSRRSNLEVAYNGLDLQRFQPARRAIFRDAARQELSLNSGEFALLLIGNDWRSKGLPCVLNAVARLDDINFVVLVVGRDNSAPFEHDIQSNGLSGRVRFLPARPDVEFYYSAADLYVSPTLEDAFALPPAEAMACGLPIITSRNNGGSEIVRSGENGFILEDPTDFLALEGILRRMATEPQERERIGQNAVITAGKLSWDSAAACVKTAWEQVRVERALQPSK